jgi:hypothetical protein
MRAADLTSEHIGQTIAVEADFGLDGRISAAGKLIQASHGLDLFSSPTGWPSLSADLVYAAG